MPTARPGQGDDNMCPLGKAEHMADRVSHVLKVTLQTVGPAPPAEPPPQAWGGPGSLPALPVCTFFVELLMSNLGISQAFKEGVPWTLQAIPGRRALPLTGLNYLLNPGPGEGRSMTLHWPLPGSEVKKLDPGLAILGSLSLSGSGS